MEAKSTHACFGASTTGTRFQESNLTQQRVSVSVELDHKVPYFSSIKIEANVSD